ncbi:unnamed protein product [Cuscuta campestris]|uniref:Replication factor A C-terminal domain-containing protein n=1 Tax=Cuscuta campestris TaxID=132261 RepID=A0A484KY55_9ASTE|nr:unnamed protein product [Cuscuta campestris]
MTFFDVTKLILDRKFPPILEFKKKLLERGVTSHEVLSLSASTLKSMPSQFDVKTLEEVCEDFEKGRVWILCKIVAFAHYGSWCYTSCKKCYKKVIPTNGISFCADCNLDGFVLRYRLQVRVVDETNSLTLTLWDKQCIPLFGRHAGDYLHDSGDDTEIPQEFNSIMYKPLLIELEVKRTGSTFNQKQYSVNQIIKDKEVLDRFQIDSSTTQGSVTSKPHKSIAEPIDLVGSETFPYEANVNNQGSKASTSTPNTILKRDLNMEYEDQATHLKKKPKVSIKFEKE